MSKEKTTEEVVVTPEKVEAESTPKTTTKVNPDAGLTGAELVAKYTIKDSTGLPIFVDTEKVWQAGLLSDEEAEKFLGGKNPKDYFYAGEVHKSHVKNLGDLLDEDRPEVQTLRRIAPQFGDLLMFKDRYQNLYHILIPKRLSETQTDASGEYTEKLVKYEVVPVNFNASVSTKEFGRFPSAFEPVFFQKWFARTLAKLNKKAQENLIR